MTNKREPEDLAQETTVVLPLGHILVMWDILANKLAGPPLSEAFSRAERRAIWSLQDVFEDALTANGIEARDEQEWNELMARVRQFALDLPADFLD